MIKSTAAAAALTLAAMTALPADATGVTLIQQKDGSVKTYSDVYIRLVGQTLTLRSPDGKGLLTITTGSCSFAKDIEQCLPYAVTLEQNGKTHVITVSYGTVFLNLTNAEHHLSLSSDTLAPHTALVIFKTAHGTYVTSKGKLDEVKP
jgi:hypothetical protein